MVKGFDLYKYISTQKKEILKRVRQCGNKLYFELGGKLLDDWHATRVLPGFEADAKVKLFYSLKDQLELVICINSENIQNGRIRSDYNNLYEEDCIRLINDYRKQGFLVSGVALTVFKDQPKAVEFAEKLKRMGEKVYFLKYIPDYPNNFEAILQSFEENDFIETTRPLVIMTSSGSASGKLSACLSQIYKEYKKGNKVGYAKYDIFPVWNLPINHPLNLAFEAATADSEDKILIDTFYYERYHKIVSNYNRDLLVYPVIKKILMMVEGKDVYSSPTEMVINTVAEAITDDELICKMGRAEVCRRYLTYYKQYLRGDSSKEPIARVEAIMKQNNITMDDLEIVPIARALFEENKECKSIALQLEDKSVLFVHETEKFSLSANLVIKVLQEEKVLSKSMLKKICMDKLKVQLSDIHDFFKKDRIQAYNMALQKLKGCNAHTSCIISPTEELQIKSLGINLTCEPKLES